MSDASYRSYHHRGGSDFSRASDEKHRDRHAVVRSSHYQQVQPRLRRRSSLDSLSSAEEEYGFRDRHVPPRRVRRRGESSSDGAGVIVAVALAFVSALLCFGLLHRRQMEERRQRGYEDDEDGQQRARESYRR
jgi:hypothetical protein